MDWSFLSPNKIQKYLDLALDQAVYVIPRIALAVLILWLGLKIIKKLKSLIDGALIRIDVAVTLRPFISSLINVSFKVFLFVLVANIIGYDVTGIIAILAAAGFAVGMALQGSIGNFASGVLILSLQPYKINDWISVDEKFGSVEEIGIFNTVIITPGKKHLIVPNSKITDSIVTNYSVKGIVRLEVEVTIPYEESYPRAESIIKKAITASPLILSEPEAEIGILSFDSHSVLVTIRPFVLPDDFWQATLDLNAAIKNAFHEANIKMAYAEGVELGPIGE